MLVIIKNFSIVFYGLFIVTFINLYSSNPTKNFRIFFILFLGLL